MSLVSQIYKRQQQRLKSTSGVSQNKPSKGTEVSKVQSDNLKAAKTVRTRVAGKRASVAEPDMPRQKKRIMKKGKSSLQSAILPDIGDWEIVEILDRRTLNRGGRSRMEYKVQWKSTWVAEEDVNAKDLLLEFESRQGF